MIGSGSRAPASVRAAGRLGGRPHAGPLLQRIEDAGIGACAGWRRRRRSPRGSRHRAHGQRAAGAAVAEIERRLGRFEARRRRRTRTDRLGRCAATRAQRRIALAVLRILALQQAGNAGLADRQRARIRARARSTCRPAPAPGRSGRDGSRFSRGWEKGSRSAILCGSRGPASCRPGSRDGRNPAIVRAAQLAK